MKTEVVKKPNNTYEVHVTLEKDKVDEYFNQALLHEAEGIEIDGFRKGKAPIDKVKEKVDKSKLRGHALNHIITDIFPRIISENHLKPVVQPRFEIELLEEGQDMKLKITIVEKPVIKLNDYKKALKVKFDQEKLNDLTKTKLTNQEVVDILLSVSEVEISEFLVEEELNRMMASLLDQTSKLGLNIDQYLEAINKTTAQVREEYRKTAESTLKADFIVMEIAQHEGLKVSDDEIKQTIEAIPDEKSKEVLSQPEQKNYIYAVLLKAKTLEMLGDVNKTDIKSKNTEESLNQTKPKSSPTQDDVKNTSPKKM